VVCPKPPEIDILKALPLWFHEAWTINKVHVFGITPKDYENLSINFSKIMKSIAQLKERSAYFEDCIDRHNGESNGS